MLSALELIKSHKKSFEKPLVSVHTSSAMRYKTIDGAFRHAFFDDLFESNLRKFGLVLVEAKDTPYSSKTNPEIASIRAEFFKIP